MKKIAIIIGGAILFSYLLAATIIFIRKGKPIIGEEPKNESLDKSE